MKVKVVKISELLKDNPEVCLSPYRVFKECHKCSRFNPNNYEKMKCKPQITPEIKKLLEEKKKLLNKLEEINKKLKLQGDIYEKKRI